VAAQAAEAAAAEREAREAREDAILVARRILVLDLRDQSVLMAIGPERRQVWITRREIDDAATQADTGDGLVPVYRALRRLVAGLPQGQTKHY